MRLRVFSSDGFQCRQKETMVFTPVSRTPFGRTAGGAPPYSAERRADSALRLPPATSRVRGHFAYAFACSPATHPAPNIAAPRTFPVSLMSAQHSPSGGGFVNEAPRPRVG